MAASRVGQLALLGAILVAHVACTTGIELGSSPSDEDAPSMSDEFTRPSSIVNKSLAPAVGKVTGVLTFDDIEGGCAFIESADGTRYEVVYPDSWTLDLAAAELRSDDGRSVRAGDTLTVRGVPATDRSSTCQVGPIFIADEVEAGAP